MRWLSALALLSACLALPGYAQRGGARGGGFGGGGGFHAGRGGFHAGGGSFGGGHSGFGGPRGFVSPGFRGGAPGLGRPGFYGGSRTGTSPGIRAPYGIHTAPRGFIPGASSARPGFYNRYGVGTGLRAGGSHIPYTGRYPYGGRYPYRGYGGRYPYSYPRFFSPRFGYPTYLSFGFFDPFFWGYDPFWDTGDWMGYDTAPYSPQVSANAGPGDSNGYSNFNQGLIPQGQVPEAQGWQDPQSGPDAADAPGPWAPQSWTGEPATVPAQEHPVTIVFKDGRPPVRIRNYAMTRTVIFTGTGMPEIRVDEVDVPATQRLNQASGVDFRLP